MDVVVTRFLEPWADVRELASRVAGATSGAAGFRMLVFNRGGDGPDAAGDTAEAVLGGDERVTVVASENVGREAYVILKYICDTYDRLPERVVFCPASWQSTKMKRDALVTVLEGVRRAAASDFCPTAYRPWHGICDSRVDGWHGTSIDNAPAVKEQPFHRSAIRPYGDWFVRRIQVPTGCQWKNKLTHFGIFLVTRDRLLQYSREQYAEWLAEIASGGPNSELGHFWEYSWAALFG